VTAVRFSLLHPSRGRLGLAEAAIAEWSGKASGAHRIEHILSIDADDDVAGYQALASRTGVRLIVNPNRSLVDAANHAARIATGEVFIVVSDDFGCPDAWDATLAAILGDRRDVAILVDDGVDGRILTLPIIGRALYERLGYVYHPAYFSMFVDDDLTETAAALGKLVDARHLRFPHRHYSIGQRESDATYARQNSARAWRVGRRTFERRQVTNFGLQPRTLRVRARELVIDARYAVRVVRAMVGRARRSLGAVRRAH
jgi:hypothetical protein